MQRQRCSTLRKKHLVRYVSKESSCREKEESGRCRDRSRFVEGSLVHRPFPGHLGVRDDQRIRVGRGFFGSARYTVIEEGGGCDLLLLLIEMLYDLVHQSPRKYGSMRYLKTHLYLCLYTHMCVCIYIYIYNIIHVHVHGVVQDS